VIKSPFLRTTRLFILDGLIHAEVDDPLDHLNKVVLG
jgi:hypothetical protein